VVLTRTIADEQGHTCARQDQQLQQIKNQRRLEKRPARNGRFNNPDSFIVFGDETIEASAEGNLCGGRDRGGTWQKVAKRSLKPMASRVMCRPAGLPR